MEITYLKKYIPYYEIACETKKRMEYTKKHKYLETIILKNKKTINACLFPKEKRLIVYFKGTLSKEDINDVLMFLENMED